MFLHRKRVIWGIALLAVISALPITLRKNAGSTQFQNFREYDEIKKDGRLNVVTTKSEWGFSSKNNTVSGFNYEIAKAFADSMKMELAVTTENNLGKCIDGIKEGKYDIIAVCIPTTLQMKLNLAFSTPIYESRQVLVQQSYSAKSVYQTLLEQRHLSKDSICIPSQSPHRKRLENLSDEIALSIKIVEIEEKTTEDLVAMVSKGDIKFTVCDEVQAKKLQQRYSNISIEIPVGFNQPMAWGVHRNARQLQKKLNYFLHDFLNSTEYWNIYRKYF